MNCPNGCGVMSPYEHFNPRHWKGFVCNVCETWIAELEKKCNAKRPGNPDDTCGLEPDHKGMHDIRIRWL